MALEQKHQRSEEEDDPQSSVLMLFTEIMVQILLKLPVDSLLRCKSVCKSWYSLISDPHFIKSHLAISTRSNNHRLAFSTWWGMGTMLKSCPLYDSLYDKSVNALKLDFPFARACNSVWIEGSCNGLLFIAIEDALFIWNPSTRKCNRLPPTGHNEIDYPVYGFGYQQSTDDYKLVELSRESDDKTFVKIYSLKTGNWKTIGVFPHRWPFTCHGHFSNGSVHWVVKKDSESWAIISLDLANETYGEVLQPVHDEGHKYMTLGSLREQLCVLYEYPGIRADLWVMKVYGVKESWAKLVSIPYLTALGKNLFSVPLCVSNDEEFLLPFGGRKLIVYDSKNGSFSELQNLDICLGACTFVESLVSPMPAAALGDI